MSEATTSQTYNILVFGETGVGKSSVVNMLFDKAKAKISNRAIGCTFESEEYEGKRDSVSFRIIDTVGLGEADGGTVTAAEAIGNLVKLVKRLETGVNVLVMVVEQGRIRKTAQNNYKTFVEGLCQSSVPVILCVTKCEMLDPMDIWWLENKSYIENNLGLYFKKYVCVTTIREGEYAEFFKEKYYKSREQLGDAILQVALQKPWKMENLISWIWATLKASWNAIAKTLNLSTMVLNEVFYRLFKQLGLDDEEAKTKGNALWMELQG